MLGINNSDINTQITNINNAQIYFILRWLELLNIRTIDTYKNKYSNTHSLLIELQQLIKGVEKDMVYRKNLECCILEFNNTIQNDIVIKNHITTPKIMISQINRIANSNGPITALKDIVNNLLATVFTPNYLNWILEDLESALTENNVNRLEGIIGILVTELINNKWDKISLENIVEKVFLERNIKYVGTEPAPTDFQSLWEIFKTIIKQEKIEYTYYFELHKYTRRDAIYENSKNVNISFLVGQDIIRNHSCNPNKVGTIGRTQNFIGLKLRERKENFFNAIKVIEQTLCEIESQNFYLNETWKINRQHNIIIDANGTASSYTKFTNVNNRYISNRQFQEIDEESYKQFLRHRDLSSYQNIINVINQYGLFCTSLRWETRLISIWTALESLMVTNHFKNDNYEHIVMYLPPILCMGYIRKIVKNIYLDFKRCAIPLNEVELNERPTTRDLLGFINYITSDTTRPAAFDLCERNVLIRKRLGEVCTLLSSNKEIHSALTRHYKRIEWHLQRIYNVRNALTHNAFTALPLEQLIDNLDYYVLTTLNDTLRALTTQKHNTIGEFYLFAQRKYNQIIDDLQRDIFNIENLIDPYN